MAVHELQFLQIIHFLKILREFECLDALMIQFVDYAILLRVYMLLIIEDGGGWESGYFLLYNLSHVCFTVLADVWDRLQVVGMMAVHLSRFECNFDDIWFLCVIGQGLKIKANLYRYSAHDDHENTVEFEWIHLYY